MPREIIDLFSGLANSIPTIVLAIMALCVVIAMFADAIRSSNKRMNRFLRPLFWIPLTFAYFHYSFVPMDPVLFWPLFRVSLFTLFMGEVIFYLDVLYALYIGLRDRARKLLARIGSN